MRRWLTVGGLTFVLLVVGAGAAWADPARPSNRSSHGVEPAGLPPFRVLGGDSFLEVTVEPGHTAGSRVTSKSPISGWRPTGRCW